jgi:hypothetical protein
MFGQRDGRMRRAASGCLLELLSQTSIPYMLTQDLGWGGRDDTLAGAQFEIVVWVLGEDLVADFHDDISMRSAGKVIEPYLTIIHVNMLKT